MTIWIGSKGLVSELELMSLGILRSEEIGGDKADWVSDWKSCRWGCNWSSVTCNRLALPVHLISFIDFSPQLYSGTEVSFYFGLINTSFHTPGTEPATNQSAWVTFPFPLCQQLSILQIDSMCPQFCQNCFRIHRELFHCLTGLHIF